MRLLFDAKGMDRAFYKQIMACYGEINSATVANMYIKISSFWCNRYESRRSFSGRCLRHSKISTSSAPVLIDYDTASLQVIF